jgi:hypothetical protein
VLGEGLEVLDVLSAVPLVVRVRAAQSTQTSQRGEGGEQWLLEGAGRAGEPDRVVELAGEQGRLEQARSSGAVGAPSVARPNRFRIIASNRRPGATSMMTHAVSSPAFHQSCGVFGGITIRVPGPAWLSVPLIRTPSRPRTTVKVSLAWGCTCSPTTAAPGRAYRSATSALVVIGGTSDDATLSGDGVLDHG